jgi:hypothetical protein
MDKGKVISAYLRGFITLKECEQILGMDSSFILGLAHDRHRSDLAGTSAIHVKQPAN